MELEESVFLTSDYTTKLVIKTVRYWHKNRNMDQWNRIESSGKKKKNSHTYGQLIQEKEVKSVPWRKTFSSIIGTEKTGQLHIKSEI